jgi:hypothetical protein
MLWDEQLVVDWLVICAGPWMHPVSALGLVRA